MNSHFVPTVSVKIGSSLVPLRGVSFCPFPTQEGFLFAVCGSRYVCVCLAKPSGETVIVHTYSDEDEKEAFYCCSWTMIKDKNDVLLLAAGEKGIIRIINASQGFVERSLVGHGQMVNCIAIHPREGSLIASASDDESARLWNIRTGSMVAIFAGHQGHRGGVLYVDFDVLGERMVTCGKDKGVKIWELKHCEYEIEASHRCADMQSPDGYSIEDDSLKRKRLFRPRFVQFPLFSTFLLHDNFVDCAMFVGQLIVSKSTSNRILLWQPQADDAALLPWNNQYTVLADFPLPHSEEWFIRFGMNWDRTLLAAGNTQGTICIWNIDELRSKPMEELNIPTKQAVAQCAFSPDGHILIAACLDGKFYRWDLQNAE
ncbi:polycomb protein EED [Galdieria sulphuraria]|uniref:Polycomb protein EED n=1 Tax=Galdieria sulphuraria TaxID=130081 RepID=M2XUG0_GALSU|nr:polycomb protein EED [Galdieria sulphuraria]EME27059.1 polycomb protein EED [Galdieria sulphuraria]|eukprot:XP_005703579.1 polycomb protein EED [Galdieria sulphuraria]